MSMPSLVSDSLFSNAFIIPLSNNSKTFEGSVILFPPTISFNNAMPIILVSAPGTP